MDWQPIETAPDEPCNVLIICGPIEWRDTDGNLMPPEPLRDDLERMELGFWDGEAWREQGTGHRIENEYRPAHLAPTYWLQLPPLPHLAPTHD